MATKRAVPGSAPETTPDANEKPSPAQPDLTAQEPGSNDGSGAPAGLGAADALVGDAGQVPGCRERGHRVGGETARLAPLRERRAHIRVERVHEYSVGGEHIVGSLGGVEGLDGYQHICGFSGHGFMLAPMAASRMAQTITSGERDEIVDSLSLARFENGDVVADAFVVG